VGVVLAAVAREKEERTRVSVARNAHVDLREADIIVTPYVILSRNVNTSPASL
jgi:hypothetical protein